ncbi:MAG: hypothetical protein WCU88_04505 [Elusimicrobiota bacterium]
MRILSVLAVAACLFAAGWSSAQASAPAEIVIPPFKGVEIKTALTQEELSKFAELARYVGQQQEGRLMDFKLEVISFEAKDKDGDRLEIDGGYDAQGAMHVKWISVGDQVYDFRVLPDGRLEGRGLALPDAQKNIARMISFWMRYEIPRE